MSQLRKCVFCGPQPIEMFSKNRRKKDGLSAHCKECNKKNMKAHYQANKEHIKGLVSERRRRNARIMRQYTYDYYKTHPCACGESDPRVLEFDHRGDKVDSIARLIRDNCSMDTLVAEIAKCDVRCANCHRKKTADEQGWYKDLDK